MYEPPDKTFSPMLTSRRFHSYQVAGKQEIRNALLDGVLVPTVAACQLPLIHGRLQQEVVQILQHLLILFKILSRWRLIR